MAASGTLIAVCSKRLIPAVALFNGYKTVKKIENGYDCGGGREWWQLCKRKKMVETMQEKESGGDIKKRKSGDNCVRGRVRLHSAC